MSIYPSPRFGANVLITKLIAELKSLETLLEDSASDIRIDSLYGIPYRHTPKVDVKAPIRVTPLFGDDAVQCAKDVFTNIWTKTGQDPKETLRAPGAIALPTRALEMLHITNEIRLELFSQVELIKPAERRKLWRSFPGISSLQVIRATPVLNAPRAINFYWDTGSSSKKYQAMDLIDLWEKELEKLHGGRPRMADTLPGSVERKLVYAIEELAKLKDTSEQVCLYRPVAPHIRARVWDGNPKPYVAIAPTPFVYDISADPPTINHLTCYIPGRKKEARSSRARLMEDPYIEAMYVYRYLEGHRAYGKVNSKSKMRNQRLATSS